MSDPTLLVLTGSLTLALLVFLVCAVWRMARGGRSAPAAAAGWRDDDPAAAPPELPAGRVAVWFYRGWDLLGVALVFGLFALLAYGSVPRPGTPLPELKATTLVVNIVFQVILAGVIAVAMVRRVGWDAWLGLKWRAWPWVFLIAPGAVVFMWMIFVALDQIGFMNWMRSLGVDTMQETVKLLQQSRDPQVLGLMAFAAVVVAPLCEEIVFRGYLYPVMKRFAGAVPAAVAAGLVFASAHGNLTALLPLFLFGLLLVYVYEKSGSLWLPVAVHCCFNSATVIAQIALRYYDVPVTSSP